MNDKLNQQDPQRSSSSGESVRVRSTSRDYIGRADNRFPAEPNRYHRFVNAGCPWAYRTILYRSIKGLADIIGITFTELAIGSEGWTFGAEPERLLTARNIHNIYTLSDNSFTGRTTVPLLWM